MRVLGSGWMLLLVLLSPASARAWNADGHRTVGAIAAQLIEGSRAATEVRALLGDLSLADATLWADCAKSIDPEQHYEYQHRGRYPACRILETPAEAAAMADFVRRNEHNCQRRAGDSICHRQYHYADVPLQQSRYRQGLATSRDDDIVAAIAATTRVLKGEPAGPPFEIAGPREALLLLAHYVGDLHQPLHAGAIYLDAAGRRVDPESHGFDPATDTHGGNGLLVHGTQLHAIWDEIPGSLTMERLDGGRLERARRLSRDPGAGGLAAEAWASDSLREARRAFRGVSFGPRQGSSWEARLPQGYQRRLAAIQARQLLRAGAHLAQRLVQIWPETGR